MTSPYVYIYRDPSRSNEVFYVGKGTARRWRDHLRGHGSNRFMQARLRKMREEGIEPRVEIVPAIDEAHAFFMEECLVAIIGKRIDGKGSLVNLHEGGSGGAAGIRKSPETRQKMAVARLGNGRPHKPETRAQMRESHLGTIGVNLGRKFGPRKRASCIHCRKETTDNQFHWHGHGKCIRKEKQA